jgi:hypothetical protein
MFPQAGMDWGCSGLEPWPLGICCDIGSQELKRTRLLGPANQIDDCPQSMPQVLLLSTSLVVGLPVPFCLKPALDARLAETTSHRQDVRRDLIPSLLTGEPCLMQDLG